MNLPALPKHTIIVPDGTGTYFNGHTDVAMQEYGVLCRLAAFEEAALLLEKIEAGYGITDRGLPDEEYERMKQTAREHQVAIRRLK